MCRAAKFKFKLRLNETDYYFQSQMLLSTIELEYGV